MFTHTIDGMGITVSAYRILNPTLQARLQNTSIDEVMEIIDSATDRDTECIFDEDVCSYGTFHYDWLPYCDELGLELIARIGAAEGLIIAGDNLNTFALEFMRLRARWKEIPDSHAGGLRIDSMKTSGETETALLSRHEYQELYGSHIEQALKLAWQCNGYVVI